MFFSFSFLSLIYGNWLLGAATTVTVTDCCTLLPVATFAGEMNRNHRYFVVAAGTSLPCPLVYNPTFPSVMSTAFTTPSNNPVFVVLKSPYNGAAVPTVLINTRRLKKSVPVFELIPGDQFAVLEP